MALGYYDGINARSPRTQNARERILHHEALFGAGGKVFEDLEKCFRIRLHVRHVVARDDEIEKVGERRSGEKLLVLL